MTPRRRLTGGLAVAAALAVPAAGAADADGATRLIVKGRGFGHGVGMSQYGALGQARQGVGYRQILRHYYSGTALGRVDPGRVLRVLIQSRGSASFSGASRAGNRGLDADRRYVATASGDRIVLRTPGGSRVGTFDAPLRVRGQRPIRVHGASGFGVQDGRYRGSLELRPAGGGVNVINAVGVDAYVRGVVAGESPASWPADALRAQAVAARTYALTTTKQGAGFDHYSDTRSQVYRGVSGETDTTDAAVADTAGEVVTYDGVAVPTFFHSTSGGRTESVEHAFGGEPRPYLRSVADPADRVSPRHRWRFSFSRSRADALLGELAPGTLRRIRVLRRGDSPRVITARVEGSRGRVRVSGATLRARLGLYDTWASFRTISSSSRRGKGGVAPRQLAGAIDPAPRGARALVQRRGDEGWRTVGRVLLGRGGRYAVALDRAGTYRVVLRGDAGPTVAVR